MTNQVKVAAAKIVEQRSHLIPGKLKVTEHFFDVPKDYHNPTSGTIRLFARSVRKHETPIEPSKDAAKKPDLPWMVYLNGGPGHPCRPPNAYPWTQTILDRGYQMLYLDQRGTGLSTPVTATTLGLRGYNETQAKYLKLYRADSIVRDCEAIRLALTSTSSPYTTKSSSSATSTSTSTSTGAAAAAAHGEPEGRKWSIMGQSFGGFCAITYLSFYPSSLREAFLFGGLQPLVTSPDAVYRSLYKKVIERNNAYYAKFPEDVARVQSIVAYLRRFGDGAIKLPSEGALTARRFQQLGINLGFHGGVDVVHDIVLRASVDIEMFGHLTRGTQSAIDRATGFDDALIYSILHEQIYCVGEAARWSAERARKEFAEFEIREGERVFFTGEMIYSWMFEDYSELRRVAAAAQLVAEDADWPALFDIEQLNKNEVPVYAAAYTEDMYVDFEFSKETAKAIKGCKLWITNVMYHDAVREKMDDVMKELFKLRDDVID